MEGPPAQDQMRMSSLALRDHELPSPKKVATAVERLAHPHL